MIDELRDSKILHKKDLRYICVTKYVEDFKYFFQTHFLQNRVLITRFFFAFSVSYKRALCLSYKNAYDTLILLGIFIFLTTSY
jgi:hypothetical protein